MKMIPEVMHHIWIGPDPLPAEFDGYRARWRELHPTWEHMIWHNDNIPALLNIALWDAAPSVAPKSVEQFRSDLLRYELLHRFGGVYVDADLEPRLAIDTLLEDTGCFVAWEDDRWLNNAIMGAAPYHPFVGDLIRGLPAHVARASGRGWRPNKLSGPQYLTAMWRNEPGGVTVYPKRYFYPYLYNELGRRGEEFPGSYAVHHWNNARRRKLAGATR